MSSSMHIPPTLNSKSEVVDALQDLFLDFSVGDRPKSRTNSTNRGAARSSTNRSTMKVLKMTTLAAI